MPRPPEPFKFLSADLVLTAGAAAFSALFGGAAARAVQALIKHGATPEEVIAVGRKHMPPQTQERLDAALFKGEAIEVPADGGDPDWWPAGVPAQFVQSYMDLAVWVDNRFPAAAFADNPEVLTARDLIHALSSFAMACNFPLNPTAKLASNSVVAIAGFSAQIATCDMWLRQLDDGTVALAALGEWHAEQAKEAISGRRSPTPKDRRDYVAWFAEQVAAGSLPTLKESVAWGKARGLSRDPMRRLFAGQPVRRIRGQNKSRERVKAPDV